MNKVMRRWSKPWLVWLVNRRRKVPSPAPPILLPANQIPPTITGTLLVGDTLTATPGTWSNADTVSGEWYVDGVATGDTDTSYTILLADAGKPVEYRETATNGAGSVTQASNTISIGSLTVQVQALFGKYSAAGGMWDFTDMATLFQDSAGTTPVTAASQPVGRVNDISGLGAPTHQPNAGKRPLYNGAGITPDGVDDFLVTDANLDLTACDKVVVGMGYTKADDSPRVQMELSFHTDASSGAFYVVSGSDGGKSQTSLARGEVAPHPSQVAGFASAISNTFGAHIARHSIPADLSEVWWNGVKGVDGTGEKGTGNFGSYPLYLFSRGGMYSHSNTPSRRALVLAPPVASAQVSDADIELIRLWLMDGVA